MKRSYQMMDARTELVFLKKQIEVVETKLDFTNHPRLLDALSYELLGLKSRMSYLIESEKAV